MSFSAKNNPTHSSIRKIRAAAQLDFFQTVLLAAFYREFSKYQDGRKKTGNLFLISCLCVPFHM